MRFSRPFLGFVFAACGGAAHALSIDGELQLHAAVGQPLSVSVPITLAGDEVSRIYYRLTPASGLAEAEERAAAQVHAAYDPTVPAIVLSTSARVTVPAMRLHLEVGAGSVVVSRDLTVLYDIPDLNKSSPLVSPAPVVGQVVAQLDNAVRPATPATTPAAVPDGAHAISIGKEEDQKTAIAYGDAAAGGAAVTGAVAVQTVIAPRPKYFNSYQVKKGDTLASVAAHFARAGAGNADAVMLAVFEANIDDFAPGNPQHPIVGRQLDIPDAASIGSEPGYRIAEFKDYLRKPVGEWQVPVTLLRKAAEPVQEVPREPPGWQQPRNLIGAAALLLVLWGLRTLFAGGKHKRAMAARRAVATGGVPAMQPNLLQAAPVAATPREAARLLTAAAPETEQAEISRLRELLTQQPGRADIRLRLAQRLFEARRASGFAEVALPLEAVLSPEAWERVRAMGHELLPSDFRFQPQAGIAPAPELLSLLDQNAAARQAATSPAAEGGTIDFDFHGEMARIDKARSDVFGGS